MPHRKQYKMSEEHKKSLAVGREQSRIVKDYLSALEAHQPRRGRKRTPDTIEKRIAQISDRLDFEDDPLTRLQLVSEREQLEHELSRLQGQNELPELEKKFVRVAADYANRKGITYTAFRQVGVPPDVLRTAGLARSA